MGVLENGIPYLTQGGLAGLAGVARSVIYDIHKEWSENYDSDVFSRDRISFLRLKLNELGFDSPELFIRIKKDNSDHYAYPDVVCMAVLEYYAFESSSRNDTAIDNYRRLAAFGLRKFIYESVGYSPRDKWEYYHDRVSILKGACPPGYFSIFEGASGMIVDLIEHDLAVNEKTIPDISVGIIWSKYWNDNNLEGKYGTRHAYCHNYPSYYPQSKSNPQQAWAYPDAALGEFRKWFRFEYLPQKFPAYILSKANLLGGQTEALKIADKFKAKAIKSA